jgi:serine/threonine-protein kinase
MTPERWRQIERVCQEALDRAPDDRAAFLDRECAGDAALRREVASLLGQQRNAEGLLETPAWEIAADVLGDAAAVPPPRFEHGRRLGPFEIDRLVGVGGMGEVYRARDTRLGRTVALKVLPPDAAADPDRKRRLETEARAASALSHPHICALFDIGSDGGVDYLVMEYLDGETLVGRMARRRAAGESLPSGLSLDEALEYGAQIAEALAAAHRGGIVHRDLKPGNVMLTPDGVKLLDFGLAKMKPALEGIDAIAEAAGRPRTVSGVVMGTANYMAPEQLRGRGADARSDLFAFGTLLYEMVAGRRAFDGSSPVAVITAILERDPPALAECQPLAPPALERLVRGCLAKDPEQRWDSALLAAQELRRIATEAWPGSAPDPIAERQSVPVPPPPSSRRVWRQRLPWLAAAAALVVAVAAIAWLQTRPASSPGRMQRLDLDLGMGFQAHPRSASALLSPDGTRIVFRGVGPDGAADLFVRRLDQPNAIPLRTGGGADPFFSPDGQWLGFFRDGTLWKVSLAGGRPVALCAAAVQAARGADWGDGGFIVASFDPSAGLLRVPDAGGAPVPITTLDASRREVTHRWPQVLPGSQAVVFTSHTFAGRYDEGTIEAVSLATGQRTTLQTRGYFGRYLPSGHLVFVRHNTLFAARMNPTRLALTGPPVPVLNQVLGDEDLGRLQFSFSTAGDALALTGEWVEPTSVPVWRDPSGPSTPLPMPAEDYSDPRVSPDGRQVAMSVRHTLSRQIVVQTTGRPSPVRLVSDATDVMPIWAPDGRHLVFASDADRGIYNLYWRRADGVGPVERLTRSPHAQHPSSMSPDGRLLAYTENSPATAADIWVVPLDLGDPDRPVAGSPRPVLQTPASEEGPAFSPDGKWLAYSSTESGQAEVYVRSMGADSGKWHLSRGGGARPVWARDGKRLFFDRQGRIMVVEVSATATAFVAGTPREWAEWAIPWRDERHAQRNFDLAPDGKRMLVLQPSGGQAKAGPRTAATLLVNFFDELRRLVPAPR